MVTNVEQLNARVLLHCNVESIESMKEEDVPDDETLENEAQTFARDVSAAIFGDDSQEGADRISVMAPFFLPIYQNPDMLIQIEAVATPAYGTTHGECVRVLEDLFDRICTYRLLGSPGFNVHLELRQDGALLAALSGVVQENPALRPEVAN